MFPAVSGYQPACRDKVDQDMCNLTQGRITALALMTVCIVMSLTLLIHATKPQQPPLAPGTPVAVVDWLKVTEGLDSWKQTKAALNAERAELDQSLAAKNAAIEDEKTALAVLPRDTPAYDEKARKLGEMRAETQGWAEYHQQRIVAKELREQIKVYNSICDATKAIAQNEGYRLVLWNDSVSKHADPSSQMSLEDAAQMISTRMVLYAEAYIDITQQVVDYLNSR